jgi:hypothetical protein
MKKCYQRRLADAAVGGRRVAIVLQVRLFVYQDHPRLRDRGSAAQPTYQGASRGHDQPSPAGLTEQPVADRQPMLLDPFGSSDKPLVVMLPLPRAVTLTSVASAS